MKLGVIADDFTGASDIALMLRTGGMSVTQFVGIPTSTYADVDAGVISLKSRTCPLDQAIEQSLTAARWLRSKGAEQIIFKVCSTFDSTAAGNIGQVAQALADELGEEHVLVCPAFPKNGRSVYQGHLFVGDRLLNESGMQNHPLTPMTRPDIREILSQQTDWQIKHIAYQTVSQGSPAIKSSLSERAMYVIDAILDQDLVQIGAAAKGRKMLVGGSGIAMGLPANFSTSNSTSSWSGQSGKAVVLSGSCSIATRAQVKEYAINHPSMELTAEKMLAGAYIIDDLVNWTMEQTEAPLLYSSADPEIVKAAQNKFGLEKSATAFEHFFAQFAAEFLRAGGERIVVAGGETSGAVVEGLQAHALEIGPEIAPGVPALKVVGKDAAIALKSGNFGQPDFFSRALKVLGETDE